MWSPEQISELEGCTNALGRCTVVYMNTTETIKHLLSSRLDLLVQLAVDEIVDYPFVVYFNGLDEAEMRCDFEGSTGATESFVRTLVGEDGDNQLMELAREFVRDIVRVDMPEIVDIDELELIDDFSGDFSSGKFRSQFEVLVERAIEELS